jgi:toxin ParE1/3/4
VSAARRIDFHPEALREVWAARDWYRARDARAGAQFLEEVERAIDRISSSYGTWPPHALGTRRYMLRRFPFLVVYRELVDRIQILAIAHARRRPGYWKSR